MRATTLPCALLAALALATLTLAACGGGGGGGDQPTSGATCPAGSTLRYTGGSAPADFGQTFMATYCTACHAADKSGAARQGAPIHANFDSYAIVKDHLALIDQMAAAGPSVVNRTMPPLGLPAPSDAERRLLGEWLACGAPQGP